MTGGSLGDAGLGNHQSRIDLPLLTVNFGGLPAPTFHYILFH